MFKKSNALPLLTIFFIFIGLLGFNLRNIPTNDYVSTEISLATPDTQYTWDSHIKSNISIVRIQLVTDIAPIVLSLIAFNVAAIIIQWNTKSHIEYCGKKMVKAIMLQWRPN